MVRPKRSFVDSCLSHQSTSRSLNLIFVQAIISKNTFLFCFKTIMIYLLKNLYIRLFTRLDLSHKFCRIHSDNVFLMDLFYYRLEFIEEVERDQFNVYIKIFLYHSGLSTKRSAFEAFMGIKKYIPVFQDVFLAHNFDMVTSKKSESLHRDLTKHGPYVKS